MERGPWTTGTDPVVGFVGEWSTCTEIDEETLESVVEECGGSSIFDSLESVSSADPTLVVTHGRKTLTSAIRAGVESPVLPVNAGPGIGSVPGSTLTDALRSAFETGGTVCRWPLLGVGSDRISSEDNTTLTTDVVALFDVTLVTAEPAHISEFTLRSRGSVVSTFRADGVVVATPAGSHGYAHAADGPLIASDVSAVAAVPIAPFVTRAQRWVLPDEHLEVTVERDESVVELRVDDVRVATAGEGSSVEIGVDGWFSTLVVAESGEGSV